MITLELGNNEYYDGSKNQFIYEEGYKATFEYSLKALYIWESRWQKPFLKGEHTEQELLDFYVCMAIDPVEERHLTADVQQTLADYIQETQTATTFTDPNGGSNGNSGRGKIHSAEEIYALMFLAAVPIDFEHRNLNRLLVILRIINAYNSPPKKMSQEDILRQNAELNRKRRAEMKTKG